MPRAASALGCRQDVRPAAVAADAERQHVRMFEQGADIRRRGPRALLDERTLQRERLGVRHESEPTDFERRHLVRGAQACAGSQFSSVCFT